VLGYTPKQLKDRIMSHPNWESVKDEDWHLDHIFPIKAFMDRSISDLKTINSLENLRPVLALENHSKNDDYDPVLFESWLESVKNPDFVPKES
jgi:hypothetical protein